MEKPAPSAEALTHYVHLAAAYVRGKLQQDDPICPYMPKEQVMEIGRRAGLKLHRFKRKAELPRVRRVIGMLKAIQPRSILDVGSGRGVFLWPLIDAFPHIQTRAVDVNPRAAEEIQAVADGGIHWLAAMEGDIQRRLPFPDASMDVVTILEVLEHLGRPDLAVKEALRIAEKFVIASVPSKEDDNPEHINLFSAGMLKAMFLSAGARSVKLDGVLNHMILLARK